jgi:hypothetical protein
MVLHWQARAGPSEPDSEPRAPLAARVLSAAVARGGVSPALAMKPPDPSDATAPSATWLSVLC